MLEKNLLKKLNVPKFYAIELIYLLSLKPFGRRKIAEKMHLTESKTRTLINHLIKFNYLKISTKGFVLTKKSRAIASKMNSKIIELKEISVKKIVLGEKNAAVQLRGIKKFNALHLRDEALKANAVGATIIQFRGKKFVLPFAEGKKFEKELNEVKKFFPQSKSTDLVIISSANNKKDALNGLWTMLNELLF